MKSGHVRSLFAGVAAAFAVAVVVSGPASAAPKIPCSTAKLIVPWGPGGGTAVIFGLVVEALNKAGAEPRLQMVTIPGQGGNKGAKVAREAKADGCTLFAIHQSAITSYLNGRVDFTWDAFEPVALLTHTPSIIGANKDVAYDDAKGLIAAAKANPGKILAGGTLGSTSHFIFILFEEASGIKFKHVSYDGTRQRMTALLAHNVDVGEINVAAAQKYIQAGELKALGIATPARDARVTQVPTLKELGVDLVFGLDRGVMLPKGTPADVVAHYEGLFLNSMKDPGLKQTLEAKGNSIIPQGSADYRRHLEKTYETLKAAAIKVGLFKK